MQDHGTGDALAYDRVVPTPWKLLAEMRVRDPSLSYRMLAKAIGYSYQSVLLWVQKPEYQRYENWVIGKELRSIDPVIATAVDTTKRVRETFETHAADMQDRLLVILETVEDPGLQAKIAQDWLDRAGHGVAKVQTQRNFALVMTPELVEMFKTRAREAELITDGQVIDATAG